MPEKPEMPKVSAVFAMFSTPEVTAEKMIGSATGITPPRGPMGLLQSLAEGVEGGFPPAPSSAPGGLPILPEMPSAPASPPIRREARKLTPGEGVTKAGYRLR